MIFIIISKDSFDKFIKWYSAVIAVSLVIVAASGLRSVIAKEEESTATTEPIVSIISDEENIPAPVVYQPYEHVYMRSSYCDYDSSGLQISVPEGYEILDVTTTIDKSNTNKMIIDIWFVNTQTVEVQPVYNEDLECYDYSNPGIVIEPNEPNLTKTL